MSTNPVVSLAQPDTAQTSDSIRVFVRECRVELRVGVYESEMDKPQPLAITVEVEAALPHHYHDRGEKKLARVIDYEPVYSFMCEELPRMGHIYLLETVAERIIDFCFQDIRVRSVRVRIEKTGLFRDAAGAGIDMLRTRPVA